MFNKMSLALATLASAVLLSPNVTFAAECPNLTGRWVGDCKWSNGTTTPGTRIFSQANCKEITEFGKKWVIGKYTPILDKSFSTLVFAEWLGSTLHVKELFFTNDSSSRHTYEYSFNQNGNTLNVQTKGASLERYNDWTGECILTKEKL